MVADNQIFPGTKYTFGKVRQMCRKNIALFSMLFFPHHVIPSVGVPDFHKEMHELTGDRNNKFVLIIAPRGFAKTTRVLFIDTMHDVAYNNERFIILTSGTTDLAETYLRKISFELEFNQLFRATYGNFVTKKKWTQGEILLGNGLRIVAKGSGKRIRGISHGQFRPTKIIVDDPQDAESSDSDREREKIQDWFDRDVCFMLSEGVGGQLAGRVIVVGTIVHSDCLVANLQKDKRFKQLFYQAIVEKDGKEQSLWEEYKPLAGLIEEREAYESLGKLHKWMMERQNIPMSVEDRLAREGDLREWDGNFIHEKGLSRIEWGSLVIPVEMVTSVDLASRDKKDSDFTVIMTTGMDAKRNLYMIDYWRKRETHGFHLLVALLLQIGRFRPSFLVIETTANQQVFSRDFMYLRGDKNRLRDYLKMENASEEDIQMVMNSWLPPVIEVPHAGKSKESRILGTLQTPFRMHRIFHRPFMHEFKKEALRYPQVKRGHDDIVDTLEMCFVHSHGASLDTVQVKKSEVPVDAFLMRDGSEIKYTNQLPMKWSAWI